MCLPDSASSKCFGQTKGRMPRSESVMLEVAPAFFEPLSKMIGL
jgi:hypothetical protein